MEWIVTDDVNRESWRRLLEFANVDLTIDVLKRIHGVPKSDALAKNYRKQAQQIRACVLQAKEYFDAAISSSLVTSPNHLYYGFVALSSMQMLVLGTGLHSLDYLRKDSENAHHGLRFSIGCTASAATRDIELLKSSRAEILKSGHFLNWYRVLPARVEIYGLHKFKFGTGELQDYRVCGHHSMCRATDLVGRQRSVIELLRLFPDLVSALRRYGMTIRASRSTQEVVRQPNGAVSQLWTFHDNFQKEQFNDLLAKFEMPSRFIHCIKPISHPNGAIFGIQIDHDLNEQFQYKWPESRDTLDHESISFADEIDTHELVDGFLVAYQLSMLSRYYPDLWVACLESHCKAAKLVEQTTDLLIRKAPILVLSMLTAGGLTISTHRAPWK